MVALWPNPLTFLLAVAIIGSRQLGLAILMHDGAHGVLARNARAEHGAQPVAVRLSGVRRDAKPIARYHLKHHAHTQQDDDPDLVLSAPFPDHPPQLPAQILARHHRPHRLCAAQGAVPQRARRSVMAARRGGPRISGASSGRRCVATALLFAALAAAGVWWAYPLLWLLPLLTWMMVITRIRNIAEHAVVPDSDDPLRNTRTTRAGLYRTAVHRAVLRELSPRTSSAVLRALLQPAAHARNSVARAACRAHGSAAGLRRRPAPCDREAGRARTAPARSSATSAAPAPASPSTTTRCRRASEPPLSP